MPRHHARGRRPARPEPRPTTRTGRDRRATWAGAAALILAGLVGAAWIVNRPTGPDGLKRRAEAAEAAGDPRAARDAWRALNRTDAATGRSHLAEARAALALDLASEADAALGRACRADPADPEPWRLRLDLLRTEGRTVEASRVGWAAYRAVAPAARAAILRELTLALLLADDDLPDDRALARVERWAAADPADVEAILAVRRRARSGPRPGERGPSGLVETLEAALARDPGRATAREGLVEALIERGDEAGALATLEGWPEADRDPRRDRLDARLALDATAGRPADPARAAADLARVLADFPDDWKARAGLARALAALGRRGEAAVEAARVATLRERLAPDRLVPRIADDLARPDDPRSLRDLAALCDELGLTPLADAWRREALARSTSLESNPIDAITRPRPRP